MYFFVRFAGIVKIILGILLMLAGIAVVIYGFVQNAALVYWVNTTLLASSNTRLLDARFYASILGLVMFLAGMSVSALGQLLLVFADIANHTRDTNALLRAMRRVETPASTTN